MHGPSAPMPPLLRPLPVLLHGFLGFRHVGPIHYFRGIEAALRADGCVPLIPTLPPVGTVADRAEVLASVLRRHPADAFVLLGHSMGGLDARFLAAHLDPDHRVKAVVTVATPHLGTAVAQRLLDGGSPFSALARRYLRAALRELDPEVRRREPILDRVGVDYISYAATRPASELPLWLAPFTKTAKYANDGLVGQKSAAWGEFRGSVRADHFEVVGWSLGLPNRAAGRPFDHIMFWRQIADHASRIAS